jgi:hypothetical protein
MLRSTVGYRCNEVNMLKFSRLARHLRSGFEGFGRHLMGPDRRAARTFLVLAAVVSLGTQGLVPDTARAATSPPLLKPSTVDAFSRYVRLTDARNDAELKHGTRLLWIDDLPETERTQAYTELRDGSVKMRKLETLENGATISCPDGMIHHWVGLAFVPGVKLSDVLAILEDYNQHSVYYAPDVEQSKIESRNGDRFRVFLRFRRHKIVTVVLNTEHDVQYFRDSDTRAHSRSSAVRIAQVENSGKSSEREKPTGDDDGFLWRMETWWRMIEADGGVYVQSEVVSLTRDIPTGLAWMIGPFVTSIPKESLAFTLEATRKVVISKAQRD